MTPEGPVTTVVKGAVRPKSAFLGQYDLNYTCEIVYYSRARGELHALRECSPLSTRDSLRSSYRALVLAEYMRSQTAALAPHGSESEPWLAALADALDSLCAGAADSPRRLVATLLGFELEILSLSGLSPEVEAESGSFSLRGERQMPISQEVAHCIGNPKVEKNMQILLDAARAIGVFYAFHLDSALETRRTVLRMISNNEEGTGKQDGQD
jgi:recombinational DNA repair protein (RecF pathway)